ncbi:carcinoembryonic antigen-related cell adhesion molecule 5-like [Acipenser oxyrinchus oxyrinchus]|uniref:Carcinoembryonic antigen-related cell adhesion molecule 5-like n=1 Tax=Acipenser oxyrinchus oxyrinchus TaxID=40147 RepID=A0AAD8FXD5_ACIOX|nr:carcinoembryonic antigen-related cell adhesion molecule 5-like [Acipenser oxyrinchus oxyrinchus]
MEVHLINWIIISLCAGCLALEVKPVTDPVISKVGDNVQLEIKPPGVLAAVIWSFSPANILVVSWVGFNPVIAPEYVNRVTLNTATGSVELRSVSLSDAGVYAFQGLIEVSGNAENINGKVTLNVYEAISNVNVKPSLAQPIAIQALKLTCEVLGSQTVSSRLWLKDGQPLSTSDRITLSVDKSTVSFNPVLQSDNGEYQCKASNPVSEETSAVYRLEVNYGPEQASLTGPDQAVLNSSVTFTCSAQSLPPCNHTWYFNGTETAQGSQYKIASVSNADRGSYTCVAWNSVTGRNTSAVKEFTVTEAHNIQYTDPKQQREETIVNTPKSQTGPMQTRGFPHYKQTLNPQ